MSDTSTEALLALVAQARPTHYAAECLHCGVDEAPPETCPTLRFIRQFVAALEQIAALVRAQQTLDVELTAYKAMVTTALEKWAGEFQPAGAFDGVLLLGDSAIVDGGRWLVDQVKAQQTLDAEIEKLPRYKHLTPGHVGCLMIGPTESGDWLKLADVLRLLRARGEQK